MIQNLQLFLIYLAEFVILLIFLLLTYNKSRKQNLPIRSFILNLLFGFLYFSGELFYQLNIIQTDYGKMMFKSFILFLSSIQIIWVFIFIEELNRPNPHNLHNSIVIALFVIQIFGYWVRVIIFKFSENDSLLNRILLLIGRFGYNSLAIFVYFLGVITYFQLFNYTRERKGFVLFIAVILILIGYFITFSIDIIRFFMNILTPKLEIVKIIGDILPIVGLMAFIFIYFLNLKYIFRIPHNHYFLLVSDKYSGSIIFSKQFEVKNKEIEIKSDIFSGMLFAINQIYSNIFKSSFSIKEIASDDISILIKNGEDVSALIVTDRISSILEKGLSKFVREFEKKFGELIRMDGTNLSNFRDGIIILNNIFPFLVEKKNQNSFKS